MPLMLGKLPPSARFLFLCATVKPRFFTAVVAALFCYGLPPSAKTADMSKTLHALVTGNEGSLDPAVASNVSALEIIENVFDPLLRYDYLARPVRLEPNTVVGMPEIREGGKTYVFKLRPGILFTPTAAFGQQRRELTAQDYVYSFKRLYDPALKSPWLPLFEGKLAGDEPLRRRFDIDSNIDGLQAVDRYTLRIHLNAPDRNFLYLLAMPATGAVAREAVERGGVGGMPIGTGPYSIAQWQRGHRIALQANPDYRKTVFHENAPPSAEDAGIAAALKGRALPLIGHIDIRVVEEEQARVLGFLGGEFDYLEQVPPSLLATVLSSGPVPELKPDLARRGIRMTLSTPLQTDYLWMNMDDPVLGGYGKDRIALRRALAMAYPRNDDIRLFDHGMALPAVAPVPPGIPGYVPADAARDAYDPALARALLDRFGYRIGKDGRYRSLPDGRPLTLVMHSIASGAGRLRNELWKRSFDAIGIKLEFKSDKLSEILKAARLGQVQMFETNWIADFPDAENFYQLLYGPNGGRANYARFNLAAFDRLYEKAAAETNPSRRLELYREMNRLIDAYAPWVLCKHPLSVDLRHAGLLNYKRHPAAFTAWRYLDVKNPAH